MKKPAPVSPDTVPQDSLPLPSQGGSYIRLADGTLQLEEATDNTPEARPAAAVEEGVEAPVKEV
jgi:hypothetical protein